MGPSQSNPLRQLESLSILGWLTLYVPMLSFGRCFHASVSESMRINYRTLRKISNALYSTVCMHTNKMRFRSCLSETLFNKLNCHSGDQTFRALLQNKQIYSTKKKRKETTFPRVFRKQSFGNWKMKKEMDILCVVRTSPCLEPVLQLLLFHVVLSIPAFICKSKSRRKTHIKVWTLSATKIIGNVCTAHYTYKS